jgi:hypothetical protein
MIVKVKVDMAVFEDLAHIGRVLENLHNPYLERMFYKVISDIYVDEVKRIVCQALGIGQIPEDKMIRVTNISATDKLIDLQNQFMPGFAFLSYSFKYMHPAEVYVETENLLIEKE